jgi:hypothetical protein
MPRVCGMLPHYLQGQCSSSLRRSCQKIGSLPVSYELGAVVWASICLKPSQAGVQHPPQHLLKYSSDMHSLRAASDISTDHHLEYHHQSLFLPLLRAFLRIVEWTVWPTAVGDAELPLLRPLLLALCQHSVQRFLSVKFCPCPCPSCQEHSCLGVQT